MQLYPVLLLVVIIAHDTGVRLFSWDDGATLGTVTVGPGAITGATWGWMGLILLAAGLVFQRTRRHMGGYSAVGALMRAERIMRWARMSFIAGFAVAVLCLGWLEAVRSVTGNLVLVDELIAMSPVFIALALAWWLFYPIDMHVRSAMIVRRLDEGGPIYPMPSRPRYVLQQFRLHVLMLLVPILLILGASQTIALLARHVGEGRWPQWIVEVSTLVAAAVVFIFAPYVVRLVLDVKRLPPGQVLEDLHAICREHGVRLRGGLVWLTGGNMINAAVMGLFGPMRYILVTDALLDLMNREQLKAVFAHEIGHVRRHHMLWMALCLIASLLLMSVVVDAGFLALTSLGVQTGLMTMQLIAMLAALGGALLVFGWVSRRFERQADTFAVQHLTTNPPRPAEDASPAPAPREGGAEKPAEQAPAMDPTVSEHTGRTGTERADGKIESAADQRSANSPRDGQDAAGSSPPPHRRDVIAPHAVSAMATALHTIARVNGVDPEQSSWRHGSIGWRTRYLQSIIGRPINHLEIDRIVSRIKLAALCMLVASLTYSAWRATSEDPVPGGGAVIATSPNVCAVESAAAICGRRPGWSRR